MRFFLKLNALAVQLVTVLSALLRLLNNSIADLMEEIVEAPDHTEEMVAMDMEAPDHMEEMVVAMDMEAPDHMEEMWVAMDMEAPDHMEEMSVAMEPAAGEDMEDMGNNQFNTRPATAAVQTFLPAPFPHQILLKLLCLLLALLDVLSMLNVCLSVSYLIQKVLLEFAPLRHRQTRLLLFSLLSALSPKPSPGQWEFAIAAATRKKIKFVVVSFKINHKIS